MKRTFLWKELGKEPREEARHRAVTWRDPQWGERGDYLFRRALAALQLSEHPHAHSSSEVACQGCQLKGRRLVEQQFDCRVPGE
jgi:hypothetical protein